MDSHLSDGWDVVGAIARAVIVTDAEGVVRVFNPAACDLFGWSADEAIGRSVVELLSLPDRIDVDASDLAAVAAGVERAGDRWVRRRDGARLLVETATRPIHDDRGHVVAMVGISEDVTQRRRSEANARELILQHRTALAAGALGTWHWNAVTGSVTWDEQLERLFGLPVGGFDGSFSTYVALLHQDDRERVLAAVDGAMLTGSNYQIDHRIVRPDGEVRWIRCAASVIDEAGASIGTVGCASDVTAEVEATTELRRLNALAVDAAQRERVQRERLEFIGRVNDALADSFTVHDVMTRVTRTLVPGLGTWCSLYVFDDPGDAVPTIETWHAESSMVEYARQLQAEFPYDPDALYGVPAVIRERRSEFVPSVDASLLDALDLTEGLRAIVEDLGLTSSIAVPLVKGQRVLGALQLVTAYESRRFTDDDVALAEALAGRIAATIDNIRLRENARATSLILQQSLLPAALPDIPGLELAVRYWPAGEGAVVGGDFYDVFALDGPDRWAIMIGDVCGTGPRAAALTGLARHTARDAAWHGDRPDEVLRAVHRAVQRSETPTFVTAIFGEVDLSGSAPRLTIAVGGHPLPLLGRDRTVSAIGSHGTLLGLVDEPHVSTSVHDLVAGDVVVLYTDGATDMHPPRTLAPAEFENLVARCVLDAGSANAIADVLGDAFDAIQPFDRRDDDVAAIILRLTTTTAGAG